MANCPNCGSTHIQLKKETNVSWGRAAAGWALFGVVGAAVGAVTGEDRNVNACLDCGTSWKAADLYNILQKIENLTGAVLDLLIKEHRLYLSDFMTDVVSCFEGIAIADKEAERLLKESENDLKAAANDGGGCAIGFLGGLLGYIIYAISGFVSGFFIVFLLLSVAGYVAGVKLDKTSKASLEQRAKEKKQRATEIKIAAREKYERALDDFVANHPLN